MTRNQFSERIRQLREQKGLTQAELAEKSGLTIRSIQRLEKGDNTPRGDTLKRLSEVFEVPVESLVVKELPENLVFLVLLSLSPLVFLINPMLGAIPPFILWFLKRRSINGVDEVGKKVLNFQLSWVLIYFYFTLLLSFVIQVIVEKGTNSGYNLTELLLRRIFLFSMFILNIIAIILSTFNVFKNGKPRVLRGFALNGQKFRPVILVLYIALFGILGSGIVFPRKNYIEMEKAKVAEFAKEAIQVEYRKDGSHTDSLKQYLNPIIDSARMSGILNAMFIPWGINETNIIEIKDHEYFRSGSFESHFLHIIYTDLNTHRLFRYLFQIDRINGHYYISDYFSENMADTFFENVEIKKKNGYPFWKVTGPMGTSIFKNHQLKSYGRMTYRKLKELKEGVPYLYRMEDGKLKKQKIN